MQYKVQYHRQHAIQSPVLSLKLKGHQMKMTTDHTECKVEHTEYRESPDTRVGDGKMGGLILDNLSVSWQRVYCLLRLSAPY